MSTWSWLFTLFLAGLVPFLSARSSRASERLPRSTIYISASASLWMIAAVGYLVVRVDGPTAGELSRRAGSPHASVQALVAWTLGLTIAGVGIFALSQMAARRAGIGAPDAALARLRPVTGSDRLWMLLLLCPSAGICEEFLYRGFLWSRLAALTSSEVLAVVLASAAFGAAHLYQGWLGAWRAAVLAVLLSGPVLAHGTLMPAMASHALIDAICAVWLAPLVEPPAGERHVRRDGMTGP
jgi:membrane protease YdiL (CAAX protease family)